MIRKSVFRRTAFYKGLLPSLVLGCLLGLFTHAQSVAAADVFETKHHRVKAETITDRLEHPWAVAFLPDGRFLVTERPGRLRIVSPGGELSVPISGLPDIRDSGQGGLLDVALASDFAKSSLIYFTFSEPGDGGSSTALARAVLDVKAFSISDVRILFSQQPKSSGARHFGSRIVIAPDSTLFVTTGDRGQRDMAQDPSINRSQVVRVNPDGTVPTDNPFVGVETHRPEIWSMGHRNPQGAALHPETGELWTVEHGARGGDEVNISRAGRNYGWPVISYGRHYSGFSIGEGTHKEGMEQPVYYWDPSIAPSGMAFYTADAFSAWNGNLFVGALKDRLLARLTLQGGQVVDEERLLTDLNQRIRDVRQGPDGFLYILTDANDGRLIRLSPLP